MDNIQLYLVSGFLGSGKTTFLQNILRQAVLSRVGVIVNEFGSVGIDGKLLQHGEVTIEEINDGSIFCACLKAGFVRTLVDFLTLPIDILFVEASGMADPSSMENLLAQMEQIASRKGVERRYDYRGSICIVDAKLFPQVCDLFDAPQSQIQKASLLLVNKIDTVAPRELELLHTMLREMNPDAAIHDTAYGQITWDTVNRFVHPESEIGESLNRPDNRPEMCVIEMESSYSIQDIQKFYQQAAPYTIRSKGFFRTPDGGIGQADNSGESICVKAANGVLSLSSRDFCLVFFGRPGINLQESISAAWEQVFGCPPVFYED